MIVGGRPFDHTAEQVENAMRGVEPEPLREHLVEMLGTVFPPKQVLAVVTGWERTSFTTNEAQRVLTKLGFACRRATARPGQKASWRLQFPSDVEDAGLDRLGMIEASLATAMEAIASLRTRVETLEAR